MFEDMLHRLKENVVSVLFHFKFEPEDIVNLIPDAPQNFHETHPDVSVNQESASKRKPLLGEMTGNFDPKDPKTWEGHVSRNSLCPCGSDKKYKYCHGVLK